MEVTTKSRAELKARFVKNSIPTETDFANLIDGLFNLQDDGVVKSAGNPLSIQADGESSGPQRVLNLYSSLKDANPAWTLSLNPRSDAANANSARPGFNLGDGSGASRLFIDRTSGNVGVGTITPSAKLEVNGPLTVNGVMALNGAVTIGSTQTPQPLTVSGVTTLTGNVGIGSSPGHALHVAAAKSVRFELGSGQKLSLGGNGSLEVDAPGIVGGRFVVTEGGNVGIGTAAIDNPGGWNKVLDILGTGHSRLQVRSSGGVKTTVNSHDTWEGAAAGIVGTDTNHALRLMTNGAHRLTIDTAGNIGIGTISPSAKLMVNGATATTAIETAEIVRLVRPVDSGVKNRNSAGLRVGSFETGINGRARLDITLSGSPGSGNDWGNTPDVTVMSLLANGNVGIGTTTPNVKLEVKGGQTILEQQTWQDATLVNSWVRYDAGYNPAQYFKDSQGIVHLRGLIKGGASFGYDNDGLICTLPTGYRPSNRQLHIVCTYNNTSGRVDVLTDGRVVCPTGSNLWLSLDSISFRAA